MLREHTDHRTGYTDLKAEYAAVVQGDTESVWESTAQGSVGVVAFSVIWV